jgi:hypothetical protein
MKPPHLALPSDCLLHIARLAASPEPTAAADANAYLRQLLAVGSVCREWRSATLDAPFDADISWAQLRRFAAQVLATDARATALRRLSVSGDVPLASEVAGGVGVNSFANTGRLLGVQWQQDMYRVLWRNLGFHRIQVELCRRPPVRLQRSPKLLWWPAQTSIDARAAAAAVDAAQGACTGVPHPCRSCFVRTPSPGPT